MDILAEAAAKLRNPIVIVGFLGHAFFFSRFLVQWIVSERKGESTVPTVFWILSIGGAFLTFTYACLITDPVFMLGQIVGIVVYSRNLVLISRKARATAG